MIIKSLLSMVIKPAQLKTRFAEAVEFFNGVHENHFTGMIQDQFGVKMFGSRDPFFRLWLRAKPCQPEQLLAGKNWFDRFLIMSAAVKHQRAFQPHYQVALEMEELFDELRQITDENPVIRDVKNAYSYRVVVDSTARFHFDGTVAIVNNYADDPEVRLTEHVFSFENGEQTYHPPRLRGELWYELPLGEKQAFLDELRSIIQKLQEDVRVFGELEKA